jgi:uncharacterized protein
MGELGVILRSDLASPAQARADFRPRPRFEKPLARARQQSQRESHMSLQSIPAADIIKACEGMLRKQLYVVFTKPTKGMDPVMAVIKEHLDFQIDLERRGIMFGAGPFWNDAEDAWEGEGMVIIRAGSLAEAKQIAASDPMHKSGARSYTVRPWLLNEGTITVKMTYSDGKREIM